MLLTFIERLRRVTNIREDRGQAYTALSLDECGVFWQDGSFFCYNIFQHLPCGRGSPSKTSKFHPPNTPFSHVRQWISFARGLASRTKWGAGEGAPPAPARGMLSSAASPAEPTPPPQLGAAERCCSRPTSPSSHGAAICGWAGCGYAAREATTPWTSHVKCWSAVARKSAGRHSQLITVLSTVSTACDVSEKCSCVCITLPTQEALLVQQ